jgi:hypothetical protein
MRRDEVATLLRRGGCQGEEELLYKFLGGEEISQIDKARRLITTKSKDRQ